MLSTEKAIAAKLSSASLHLNVSKVESVLLKAVLYTVLVTTGDVSSIDTGYLCMVLVK